MNNAIRIAALILLLFAGYSALKGSHDDQSFLAVMGLVLGFDRIAYGWGSRK